MPLVARSSIQDVRSPVAIGDKRTTYAQCEFFAFWTRSGHGTRTVRLSSHIIFVSWTVPFAASRSAGPGDRECQPGIPAGCAMLGLEFLVALQVEIAPEGGPSE